MSYGPRDPAPSRRVNGRILPHLWQRRTLWPLSGESCVICNRAWAMAVKENGHSFCWFHHPDLAAALLGGDPSRSWPAGMVPSRRICERIVRLAGRTKRKKKPPRPKKRPRDRRYVR